MTSTVDLEKLLARPKTKFLKVKCQGCGSSQVIFSAPTTKVKCLACETVLAEPTASKAEMKTSVIKELE